MALIKKTPGVFIQEENAFPGSVIAVETAIPVFIGYTEVATWNDKSLIGIPTRIRSFNEYVERFGGALHAKFSIVDADPNLKQETVTLNGKAKAIKINENNVAYLFNSIRLFYANGGSVCYILAVNTYGENKEGLKITAEDFIGSAKKADPFETLQKEMEPTLIVMPDAISLGELCYSTVYSKALKHCLTTQNRFCIFDLINPKSTDQTQKIVSDFRERIGKEGLKNAAAYYPWLNTSIIQPSEISFENLDASVNLDQLLPEPAALDVIKKFKANSNPDKQLKENFDQALKTTSPTYVNLLEKIRLKWNEIPPSGAIAGIYAIIDSNKGVWKSPANVSINSVNGPSINITTEEQEGLNVDVLSGKSVNAIRVFPGQGTLIWGARTLDGNSLDWKYINVRRTVIMIEQSLKLATQAYVFEPNDANTWVTIKGMIENFLVNLWMQGGLVGLKPEEAFDVQIGLGKTMTETDILEGRMIISVKLAIIHPAEFIVITFFQKMSSKS